MNPPPNPHADKAAAAMRAAIRPLLVNPPDDDAALIARAAETWPDLGRYLADAHIGLGRALNAQGEMVQCVTVVIEVEGDYSK